MGIESVTPINPCSEPVTVQVTGELTDGAPFDVVVLHRNPPNSFEDAARGGQENLIFGAFAVHFEVVERGQIESFNNLTEGAAGYLNTLSLWCSSDLMSSGICRINLQGYGSRLPSDGFVDWSDLS